MQLVYDRVINSSKGSARLEYRGFSLEAKQSEKEEKSEEEDERKNESAQSEFP